MPVRHLERIRPAKKRRESVIFSKEGLRGISNLIELFADQTQFAVVVVGVAVVDVAGDRNLPFNAPRLRRFGFCEMGFFWIRRFRPPFGKRLLN
ncbi:MAG: hypothetical protein FJ405_04840 [Verrucomicrobia bacterium]|nr:hypothetical protein [Verrucomicrobiota bacterium]